MITNHRGLKYGEDRWNPQTLKWIRDFYIEHDLKGEWLLDIGCCTGYWLNIGNEFYDNLFGVDKQQCFIDKTIKNLSGIKNLRLERGLLGSFNTNIRFDTIFCFILCIRRKSLVNIQKIEKTMKLLKEGGTFIVDVNIFTMERVNEKFNIVKVVDMVELRTNDFFVVDGFKRIFIRN